MTEPQKDWRRKTIAYCGCGNVSVDGINFGRLDDGVLQCAACGKISPDFLFIRGSALLSEANQILHTGPPQGVSDQGTPYVEGWLAGRSAFWAAIKAASEQ